MKVFASRYNKGFSLVELMVALTLSLVIGVAVMETFLASKTTYRMQDAMSRLQENGRFAVNQLASDIRMAGYMGCLRAEGAKINVIADDPPSGIVLGNLVAVQGENNVDSHVWGAAPGTDVIVLRKAASNSMRLVKNMKSDNANIQIAKNSAGFKAGDILVISDCVSSDVFRAGNVSASSGEVTITHPESVNSSSKLSKVYGVDAEILAFQNVGYFVKDTGRKSPGGQSIRALYQVAGTEVPVELTEGVHDLQIEYGLRSGSDSVVSKYVSGSSGIDWGKVVSVRFSLLMQSADNTVAPRAGEVGSQKISYNAREKGTPEAALVAADGHLRQVFGSVVAIRNRVR